MKKIALCLLMLLGLVALNASAQTNTVPAPTPGGFLTSVGQYFTSFNPELTNTFPSARAEIWAGVDYQSGVDIAASLGIEWRAYKKLSLVSVTRNAGIAGTIVSQQLDVGLNFDLQDVQLTVGLGGGYEFLEETPFGCAFAEVKKALTPNTFAGARIETDIKSRRPDAPVVSVFWGFRF